MTVLTNAVTRPEHPGRESSAQIKPDLVPAKELMIAGLKLVRYQQHTKAPMVSEWTDPANAANTIEDHATGYGVPLGMNGLCSIDIDHDRMARTALAVMGLDLDELIDKGIATVSTRPGSGGRVTFKACEGLAWVAFKVHMKGDPPSKMTTILEFRCGDRQDAVPGVVYRQGKGGDGPLYTQAYRYEFETFADAPDLPDSLKSLWLSIAQNPDDKHRWNQKIVDALKEQGHPVDRVQASAKGTDLVLPFTSKYRKQYQADPESQTVEQLLEKHGYDYDRRTQRWRPAGSGATHGIFEVKDPARGDPGMWESWHASCPLHGIFRSFDAYVMLDHGGDLKAAEAALSEVYDKPTWAKPVDFINQLSVPDFDLSLVPKVVADYAGNQGTLMGCDPAMIAMSALAALAACLDDRIEVQVKRHDEGWTESARLWVGIIGEPSAKKSPALKKAMAPLFGIDQEWRKDSDEAMGKYIAEKQKLDKGEIPPPPPVLQRLIVNDATVEKLADLLSTHQPRGMLSFHDELSGWLSSMDVYKAGGNKDRSHWLEAANGGPRSIDRIQRGSTFVKNWSLGVLGGIQPSVVHQYAKATNHDGMLQRFLLIHAGPATLGVDRPPDINARNAYWETARFLSELVPQNQLTGVDRIKLSEGAHKVREAFDARAHGIALHHPNRFLSAALGKWQGYFARLCLLFHAIDCAQWEEHPRSSTINQATAEQVSSLMLSVLLPHMIRFYEGMDPREDDARDIANLLLARRWDRFTVKRDLSQNMRAFRKLRPWEQEEAIDRLETFQWIAPDPTSGNNERGRPRAYLVNPLIHESFAQQAEAERKRREEEKQTLRDLFG